VVGLRAPGGRLTAKVAVALVLAATALAFADDALGPAAVAALLALLVVDVPAGFIARVRRRRPRAVAQMITMAALLVLVPPAISYVNG
jgi:predicted PurR-regulated permease PerM